MKTFRLLLALALIPAFLIQCSKDPKMKINALEKKMSAENFTLDDKGLIIADELIQAYISYAENNKNSPEAPDFLYKAADLSLNTNKSKEALELYNKIIYQYPEYKKVPESLFLIAYIQENYLMNYGKAKEIYETFIARYPAHDFADDAAVSIQNMGKTPEELIRSFEEKNLVLQDSI